MGQTKAAYIRPSKSRIFLGLLSSALTVIFIILFGFGLFSFSNNYPSIYGYPESQNGTLDFSGYSLNGGSKLINLGDKGRLYFDRWIVTDDDKDSPDAIMNMRDDWTASSSLPKEGYGTLAWTLKNLPSEEPVSLRLGASIYTGFRAFFVNEPKGTTTLIASNGEMSRSEEKVTSVVRNWPKGFIKAEGKDVTIAVEFSFIKTAFPIGDIFLQTPMSFFKDSAFNIYAGIGATAVVLMLVLSITLLASSHDRRRALPFFFLSFSMLLAYVFTDFMCITGPQIGFFLAHNWELILAYASSLFVFISLAYFIAQQRERFTLNKAIIFLCSIVSSIILFAVFFNARLIYLAMVPLLAYSIYLVYMVVSRPNGASAKLMVPLLLVNLIYLLFIVFEYLDLADVLVYTVGSFPSAAFFAMALFSSYFYFIVTRELRDKALKAEENALLYERAETKNLLEAVSPHFLFNSLTLVESNYHSSLDEGDNAINLLAKNLRSSIDATTKTLIPFDNELDNITNYVDYNALRKDQEIEVLFDVEYEDFSVPPLSIQAFVDNSLKHAFLEKRKTRTSS